MRLLFSTDLHASEAYLSKIISYSKSLKVDLLIISGDLTGKALIPIVRLPDGSYKTRFFGREERFGEQGLQELTNAMLASGYYFYVCDLPEYERLREEKRLQEELFRRLMAERLEHQLRRIDLEVPREVKVIVNPGNDDDFFVDDILRKAERAKCTIGSVEELGQGLSLISCEWVNPTPWNSPRECPEEELYRRLAAQFQRAGDAGRLLCDIHAPPYDTTLDLAPKLDKDLRPKRNLFGQPIMEHVGSKAVRRAIQQFQPLLSLHGHIHESPGSYRLGRTLCLNPGSEYEEGIMHGHLVIIEGERIDFQPVIGA